MESQGRSRLGSTRTSGPSIQRIEFVRRLSSLPQNAPLVLVVAPPGDGKTTAGRPWTPTTRSPVVWLRMDQEHQDRQQLVRGLARGLLRAAPMEGLQQLAASPSDVPAEGAAGRLAAAVAAAQAPVTIVLDELHLLRSHAAL